MYVVSFNEAHDFITAVRHVIFFFSFAITTALLFLSFSQTQKQFLERAAWEIGEEEVSLAAGGTKYGNIYPWHFQVRTPRIFIQHVVK